VHQKKKKKKYELLTFDMPEEWEVGGKVSFSKPELDFVCTLGLCTTTTLSQYSAKEMKIQKS
jgi:hypothetical protein